MAERVALTRAMTRSGTVLALGPARPGARQALDRRRRRQRQPDARARRRGLRRLRADDLRPRPRPHRRHARQARLHSRLRLAAGHRHCFAGRRARSAAPSSARPPTSRPPTSASTPSATSPATVESIAAHHRLDPVEEARRRPRRPGHGREVRLRRLHGDARRRRASSPRASSHVANGAGPADDGAHHRHERAARLAPPATRSRSPMRIDYLTGRRREPRFHEVTVALAAEMLLLGRPRRDHRGRLRAQIEDAHRRPAARPRSSQRMVAALGGPRDLLDDPSAICRRRRSCRPSTPSAPASCRRSPRASSASPSSRSAAAARGPRTAIDHAVGLHRARRHRRARSRPSGRSPSSMRAREATREAAARAAARAYRLGEAADRPRPRPMRRVDTHRGRRRMSLLVAITRWEPEPWVERFRRATARTALVVALGEPFDRRAVHYAASWKHPPGSLAGLPNLAGDLLARRRRRSSHERPAPAGRADRARGRRRPHQPHERIRGAALPDASCGASALSTRSRRRSSGPTTATSPPPRDVRVGIMGLGVLGQDAARKLRGDGLRRRRLEPHADGRCEGIADLCGRGAASTRVPRPHRHPGLPAAADARHARHPRTARCFARLARDGPLGGPVPDQCRPRRPPGRGRHPRLPRRRHPASRHPRRVRDRAPAARSRRSGPTRASRSRRTTRR